MVAVSVFVGCCSDWGGGRWGENGDPGGGAVRGCLLGRVAFEGANVGTEKCNRRVDGAAEVGEGVFKRCGKLVEIF